MSDLVAEFLEKEKEELGDIDEFNLESNPNDTFNDFNDTNGDFETLNNNVDEPSFDDNHDYLNSEQPKPSITMPRIEPEKIRKWKEDFQERIVKKDEDEKVRKAQLETDAKKELQDWNKHYKEQLIAKQKINRESQQVYEQEQNDDTVEKWQRVCKMCDFSTVKSANVNPTTVPAAPVVANVTNGKDTSRMRGILMSLRTQPPIRT